MQLKLFDPNPDWPKKLPQWKHLLRKDRAAVIATLARLMAKQIRPNSSSREDNDER